LSALHNLTTFTFELILVHSYAASSLTDLIATRKTWKDSTLKIPVCCPPGIHGSHVTAKYELRHILLNCVIAIGCSVFFCHLDKRWSAI